MTFGGRMAEIKRIPTPHTYSSAASAGEFVFLALHRGDGVDFKTQFDDTFSLIKKSLSNFDLTLESLVKVNVWLKNINDLPEMEQRFARHFEKDHYPTRMTATTEFIDSDCLIMIDGVAFNG